MELYHFTTSWTLPVGVGPLWDAIIDAESWPTWTPSFRRVTIIGDESVLGLGSRMECEVKGTLPFTLRFSCRVSEQVTGHSLGLAAWGDVQGTGRWVLGPGDDGTTATYFWDVGLTNSVLDRLGRTRATKALLRWNHDRVMERAGQGLALRLARGAEQSEPSA
jgi:hypothetical protein